MIAHMALDDNVYWSVVRNKSQRLYYVEIAEGESGRWNVVLDTDEFTLRLPPGTEPNYWDLLAMALEKRKQ